MRRAGVAGGETCLTVDARLAEILLDGRELWRDFPAWMLPAEARRRLARASSPAVVEIAGRDSVAAAVLAARDGGYDVLLPTVAYTGTEYGSRRRPYENTALLRRRLAALGLAATVLEPVTLGSPALWRALAGQNAAAFWRRYGFFTPCVGCHLYLHAIRVPPAKELGCAVVVAGERESHDGHVKVNQLGPALDRYAALLSRFELTLYMPLRRIAAGAEVEALAGGGWPEDEGQLSCVLRGNYRDPSGGVPAAEEAVTRYLDEFAVPLAARAVAAVLKREVVDYDGLARELWPTS